MLSSSEVAHFRALPLRKGERNRLRLARTLVRLTQDEVAARTGIEQARISVIERGGYSQLPIETARTLAAFFHCTIEDLFPAPVRSARRRAS
jgi:DNA-binding XRE family transcriptional regulator